MITTTPLVSRLASAIHAGQRALVLMDGIDVDDETIIRAVRDLSTAVRSLAAARAIGLPDVLAKARILCDRIRGDFGPSSPEEVTTCMLAEGIRSDVESLLVTGPGEEAEFFRLAARADAFSEVAERLGYPASLKNLAEEAERDAVDALASTPPALAWKAARLSVRLNGSDRVDDRMRNAAAAIVDGLRELAGEPGEDEDPADGQ